MRLYYQNKQWQISDLPNQLHQQKELFFDLQKMNLRAKLPNFDVFIGGARGMEGEFAEAGAYPLVSVRLWNFKEGGSLKVRFLAKNQYAIKEKSLKNSYE